MRLRGKVCKLGWYRVWVRRVYRIKFNSYRGIGSREVRYRGLGSELGGLSRVSREHRSRGKGEMS